MSTTSHKQDQLLESFADPEYRHAFADAFVGRGLAFQIRAMQEHRGWTQAELGVRAGMAQETISLLENPNYGRYTLRTLKRLAEAFDVAIVVRFAPFTQLAELVGDLSENDLAVPAYTEDVRMHREAEAAMPPSYYVYSMTKDTVFFSGPSTVLPHEFPLIAPTTVNRINMNYGTVVSGTDREFVTSIGQERRVG